MVALSDNHGTQLLLALRCSHSRLKSVKSAAFAKLSWVCNFSAPLRTWFPGLNISFHFANFDVVYYDFAGQARTEISWTTTSKNAKWDEIFSPDDFAAFSAFQVTFCCLGMMQHLYCPCKCSTNNSLETMRQKWISSWLNDRELAGQAPAIVARY